MRFLTRRSSSKEESIAALVEVLRPLRPAVRAARFVATLEEPDGLKRRSWDGCPLNKAGGILGGVVGDQCSAAEILDLPARTVGAFITAWDHLKGTDKTCTECLRNAIAALDGFPLTDHIQGVLTPGADRSPKNEEIQNR